MRDLDEDVKEKVMVWRLELIFTFLGMLIYLFMCMLHVMFHVMLRVMLHVICV